MKNSVLAVTATLTLCSCVTARLTAAGNAVRLTSNPDVVRTCQYLVNIEGSDYMNGGALGQQAANENATRRLLNKAAEIGADTVMISVAATGFSGAVMRGEAYRCNKS